MALSACGGGAAENIAANNVVVEDLNVAPTISAIANLLGDEALGKRAADANAADANAVDANAAEQRAISSFETPAEVSLG